MERDATSLEQPVADALRALKEAAVVPPVDRARAAALLAAFDATASERFRSKGRRDYWHLAGFAAAAVLFVAAALTARHGIPPDGLRTRMAPPLRRDVQLAPPPDFVIVPGAAELPRMESGTLVRMDVPVSMLPSLGVTPPPGQARAVTADFIVAQDGLPRAVRLISP